MKNHYVVQTWASERYIKLFNLALAHGQYTRLDVAVAYATTSGVRILEKLFRTELGAAWDTFQKRWLIGIDWCRSDPPALARLNTMASSSVKVPNGRLLVARYSCLPERPYHPKLFMLSGGEVSATICGSGNLSGNGLTGGCECGSVTLVTAADSQEVHLDVAKLKGWFRRAWAEADAYSSLQSDYERRCESLVREEKMVPTEDDAPPRPDVSPGRGLSAFQIRQLRTFNNLWIQAGALGGNLGRGLPGNQLDMTRHTRVFFGSPASDVPANTVIDQITLIWDDQKHIGRTLKFGNNGMDKLNVPLVGTRGPLYYRNKTLLFTRLPNGEFVFTVGSETDRLQWRSNSQQKHAAYHLPGGREWGVF